MSHEHSFPEDAQKYWDMADDADMKDLLSQLNKGLIHPLEYADKIQEYKAKYGIE